MTPDTNYDTVHSDWEGIKDTRSPYSILADGKARGKLNFTAAQRPVDIF